MMYNDDYLKVTFKLIRDEDGYPPVSYESIWVKKDIDGDSSISAEDIVEKEPEEDEFQKCIKKIQSLDKFLQKKSPDFREKDELTKQQLRIAIDGLIDTLEILRG